MTRPCADCRAAGAKPGEYLPGCKKCDGQVNHDGSLGFASPPKASDYRDARLSQEADDPELEKQDMRLMFEGRTLMLTVTINTDESAWEVTERIKQAAAGPQRRMALVATQIIQGMRARNFWRSIRRAVRKKKKGGPKQ